MAEARRTLAMAVPLASRSPCFAVPVGGGAFLWGHDSGGQQTRTSVDGGPGTSFFPHHDCSLLSPATIADNRGAVSCAQPAPLRATRFTHRRWVHSGGLDATANGCYLSGQWSSKPDGWTRCA